MKTELLAMAVFLRPFVTFVLALFVLYPIRVYVQKKMKEGKLKRALLKKVN